ncbi:HNH endonuclease [Microbacterium sp. Leaf436]|uniref:HNH endonuclease n=1 Tax=Microbacterium sp. Leaf436 TaxID=1736377 RepID=UPI0006F4C220|nr:HNH endonuclease signature motif containing protein [Microbacterium sp. Leaf436]KQT75384.1 hypothetical protein ASG45_02470 [Microbacterium sp. Leaf436]
MTRDPMAKARPAVQSRSKGRCEKCGLQAATDIHHRKLRRHGDHAPANLVHLCRTCHNLVHDKGYKEPESGFLLKSWDNPRVVRVRHALFGWVRLDDAGGWETAA